MSQVEEMKNQDYNIFWQRIHKSARDKDFPLRVMFELTYRCNFKCKHCYVPESYKNRKGELKTKDVLAILDQLKDIGCFYLGFTGGEPFIREDIMEIFEYARRSGFEVIIYTNGSFIDEKIASQLQRLKPNKVDITIPAMSKHVFEHISGAAGSRNRVFNAIDILYKKGVNLGFKSCALKDNQHQIKQIQDFAASLGALHRLDDMLSPRLDGSREPYRYRNQKTEVRKQEIEEDCVDIKQNIRGQRVKTDELFKCGVGRTQAAITPFGELKMCLMIDYPKYKILHIKTRNQKLDLKEAWEKLRVLVKSIKPDESYRCSECELEPYCKWCPAKAWLNTRSFTSCDSESWRRAVVSRTREQNVNTERV